MEYLITLWNKLIISNLGFENKPFGYLWKTVQNVWTCYAKHQFGTCFSQFFFIQMVGIFKRSKSNHTLTLNSSDKTIDRSIYNSTVNVARIKSANQSFRPYEHEPKVLTIFFQLLYRTAYMCQNSCARGSCWLYFQFQTR